MELELKETARHSDMVKKYACLRNERNLSGWIVLSKKARGKMKSYVVTLNNLNFTVM